MRDGPHQHDLGPDTQILRFGQFLAQAAWRRTEYATRREFRNEIVVIGIEPLGHLHRRLRRVAPRQREVGVEADFAVVETETLGNRTQQHAHVEHMIVEREIADRNDIQPAFLLRRPMVFAQHGGSLPQLAAIDIAAPERFQCRFEFAPHADPRKAEVVRYRHDVISGCQDA